METIKPNVLDTCLSLAGYKSKNNPTTVAGLFKEFQKYETQNFNEWQEETCHVEKKEFADLRLQTIPSIRTHNGSAGESFYKDLYFVEFSDSTVEMVQAESENSSNYAYTETIRENGESISDCINRVGSRSVKRVVRIQWDYSSWDSQDTERYRIVTIYTF